MSPNTHIAKIMITRRKQWPGCFVQFIREEIVLEKRMRWVKSKGEVIPVQAMEALRVARG
jgi:hypothetical protein